MAVTATWTPFADGESLLTLRGNLNTFNQAVVADLTAHETAISELDTGKVSIADTGIVFVSGGTMPSNSLTTSYSKVGMVDTTAVDADNGHITVDNVNYTYTLNTTGIYKFVFSGAMTADTGDKITFNYNINGLSAIANPPEFVGDGARRVSIENHFVAQLNAGSVVYIEAKSDSTSTMTPINCGFTIEKTHY